MVEPIGIKAGAVVERRSMPVVASTAAAAPVASVPTETAAAQTAASEISQNLAASAPVDSDRVTRIRKAVQDGKFPLVPATVADRLLALKLEWNPNNDAA